MTLKFIFILACLCTALASYPHRSTKRDWRWLIYGLSFTAAADYFLIIRDWHLPGVAIFIFAHACYIMRGLETQPGRKLNPAWLAAPFAAVLVGMFLHSLLFLAALYALLFLANIITWVLAAKKTRQPKHIVMLTGLILFAACDINVLLFNLPGHLNISPPLITFHLIWVFYLPAQVLICISGLNTIPPKPSHYFKNH
ncbi:MAG: lysoplasmalogenase [Defluviitaleaceae bacterium]|nr:lysoplasmalogenase [Defluviitaleaceae bacterium]